MATYVMIGRYSVDAAKTISADRTHQAESIIKHHGGHVKSAYALLGENDLLLIVDRPDGDAAMKASLGLSKLSGVAFSTSPAIDVAVFDRYADETPEA